MASISSDSDCDDELQCFKCSAPALHKAACRRDRCRGSVAFCSRCATAECIFCGHRYEQEDMVELARDRAREPKELHSKAPAPVWTGTPAPREYQVQAFRQVCEQNTIVNMDTGLGKTLIAVMCIDYHLKRQPSKKVLMCVPTVQLAKQQASYIQATSTVSGIQVADVTGGTIAATADSWAKLLQGHQVIVATGQLAMQAVTEWGFLPLEQLSLLILDECHHAVGSHPFVSLMQEPRAWELPGLELPRVLGLTASYLNGRSTDFLGKRLRLEATLRSCLWCADEARLQQFRSQQTFETLSYREGSSQFLALRQRCCEELRVLLQAYTQNDQSPLWDCRQDIDRLIDKAERVFDQAGFHGWAAYVKSRILPAVTERFHQKLADSARVSEAEAAWDSLCPTSEAATSGKLASRLKPLVVELQSRAQEVLVQLLKADDAYPLAATINHYLGKSVTQYLSGVNSMSSAGQQKALRAFAEGICPVMVATPALEEGYDAFYTAKSHIQGAGRARKKDGI
ncbi:DCL3A [Symbiodinium natans]|uniref:DCL3A protein n=1 Tax=Symbiodinium natans TaxID=878477 RepID=A0A812NI98_9DINO|nr:DCL3A [Symbiodinium natans]